MPAFISSIRPAFQRVLVYLLASVTVGLVAAAPLNGLAPGGIAARPLFDGKTLAGWSIQNGGRFSVHDGVIALDRGAGWLRSDATYADFTLTVELRFLDQGANSGIFVRTGPDSHPDEKGYPTSSYQVQCMDDLAGTRPLATVIPYGGGLEESFFDREAIRQAYRPTGEWNIIEITCRGEVLVSKLNGVEVARAIGVANRRGQVGIQGEGGRLEFRRLDIVEHPPVPFVADGAALVFSGPAAGLTTPQQVTLLNPTPAPSGPLRARLTGQQAGAFRFAGPAAFVMPPGGSQALSFQLRSGPEQIGVLSAVCEITDESGTVLHAIGLHGVSTPGLEGKREAPLRQVLDALGYAVDIGWDTLAGNIKPEPMGAEVGGQLFRAAGPGEVVMTPIARYSPDFLLPYGYYQPGAERPLLHVVGTLALATPDRPEQNILHPTVASGTIRFAPPAGPFGLFTASPSHVAYTEDVLNTRLEPTHAAHAVRVFPARARVGQPMPHAYLVCFEEASNGDYQDYVFLLENVAQVSPATP
ncbi:MAG: DUF1080 domain-containing protein [Opitutus sp.]